MTVRPAYKIKTIYWGRYSQMYGDDWVDLEAIHYAESLSEAITYANDQMALPKTITSAVYSNFNNDLMYTALPTAPTNSTIGITNTVDQHH